MSVLTLAAALAAPGGAATEPLHAGYALITERPVTTDLAQTVYVRVRGRNLLEGLQEILEGTGYRLADAAAADPEIWRLYVQPFPEAQRPVGPRALGAVLERLAGPAWRLVEDPVNRRVSFELHRPCRAATEGGP
ncbi:MAG: hypothetical protein EA420_03055 [Candidatus Competibacteraceae bacterium]|nr:MAG: hypothetical protein EA420_03055 [Candidatus Competibacteraceae bacterium]